MAPSPIAVELKPEARAPGPTATDTFPDAVAKLPIAIEEAPEAVELLPAAKLLLPLAVLLRPTAVLLVPLAVLLRPTAVLLVPLAMLLKPSAVPKLPLAVLLRPTARAVGAARRIAEAERRAQVGAGRVVAAKRRAVGPVGNVAEAQRGGGQIGINSQWFGFVAELEMTFEYIGLRQDRIATFTSPISGPFGGTPEVFTFNDSFKNNLVSTQRLRLGWASDTGLIYITGGLALSQHTFSTNYSSPNFNGGSLAPGFVGIPVAATGSVNHLTAGWSAGAGIEFKLTRNWSLRAEYLYIDLGKSQFDTVLVGIAGGGAGPIGAGFTAHHEDHMQTAIARAAINYQFDWAPFLPK